MLYICIVFQIKISIIPHMKNAPRYCTITNEPMFEGWYFEGLGFFYASTRKMRSASVRNTTTIRWMRRSRMSLCTGLTGTIFRRASGMKHPRYTDESCMDETLRSVCINQNLNNMYNLPTLSEQIAMGLIAVECITILVLIVKAREYEL